MRRQFRFPEMRVNVESAVKAFADPHEQATWGHTSAPGATYRGDLAFNVNLMYDCLVFPTPADAVDLVIASCEVAPLTSLFKALDPLMTELGDLPDGAYLSDPRWTDVLGSATESLNTMRRTDCAES